MRTKVILSVLATLLVFLFMSCEDTAVNPTEDLGILPESFSVKIPGSLTSETLKSAGMKSTSSEDPEGDDVYAMLAFFIYVGEQSADLVEDIILSIAIHGINKPMELSFVSDDDSRLKNLTVINDAEFEGELYEHGLTITDAESESEEDGGKAMQVFWNTNPVNGISIIKPFNLDRRSSGTFLNTMYRVEYTNKATVNYDESMVVMISGLPLADPSADRFSLETMKMFVGRKGDAVDVYGNSNHPNAYLFNEDNVGFNWAFVASGYTNVDMGVAEVGLPPSDLNDDSRETILGDYAIKQVFTNEINDWFIANFGVKPDSADLSQRLQHVDAPGYFADGSLVQAGTMPGEEYAEIDSRITSLSPFKPSEVSTLVLSFK